MAGRAPQRDRSQDWTPPRVGKPLTFGEHAEQWLKNRKLKPRTRYHYQGLLDGKILPTFRDVPLKHVTADLVDDWYYRWGTAPRPPERTPTGSCAPSSETRCSAASSTSTPVTSEGAATRSA